MPSAPVQGFVFFMLLLVMGTACLKTGLFFDEDLYIVCAVWGVVCLLQLRGFLRIAARHASELRRSATYPLFVCIGLMLLIYSLHAIRGPLSTGGTLNEWIRWGFYGTVGFAAWILSRDREGRQRLQLIWHLTGGLLCTSAFLAVYGLWDLPHAVLRTADPAVSASGARLGGLLQYPNAFGAVMAAFLLERLFALPAALRRRAGPLRAAAALLPLAPYTAALLLTESRGAWLAAALSCAAGLAAERRQAVPLLAAAAAPAAGAALLYRQLAEVQLAPAVVPGLLWLAGLWAGGVLAGLALCRGLQSPGRIGPARQPCRGLLFRQPATFQKLHAGDRPARPGLPRPGRRLVAAWAASALYAVSAIAVWIPSRSRWTGGGETLGARELMYRDAWELAGAAPWFGQGGETWRHAYRAVQSEPYVGAEVHSGYMDLLLNTGIFGFLAALALMLVTVFRLGQAERRLVPPLSVLLLHSVLDFDWSYGLVWLLIIWLAVMADGPSSLSREPRSPSGIFQSGQSRQGGRSPIRLGNQILSLRLNWKGKGKLVLCLACLIGWTTLSAALWRGEQYFDRAQGELRAGERARLLQSALAWNPASAEAACQLARLLPPDKAISLLHRSYSLSPGHPDIPWSLATIYAQQGNSVKAAYWYRNSLEMDRHHAGKRTRAILALAALARAQQASGDEAAAKRTASSAAELYADYRRVSKFVEDSRQIRNDRGFRLTLPAELEGRRMEQWVRRKEPLAASTPKGEP